MLMLTARVRPGVCLEAPRLPHGVEITVVVGEAAIVIVRLVVIRTVAVATVGAQEVPRRAQDGQHDKCIRRRDYWGWIGVGWWGGVEQ